MILDGGDPRSIFSSKLGQADERGHSLVVYRDSFHAHSRALQILHKTPDIFILGISEAEEPVYAVVERKECRSQRLLALWPSHQRGQQHHFLL